MISFELIFNKIWISNVILHKFSLSGHTWGHHVSILCPGMAIHESSLETWQCSSPGTLCPRGSIVAQLIYSTEY